MNVTLPPKISKLIRERVKSGMYESAEDLITTAVESLANRETFGDFAAGELDTLLAEGERDVEQGRVLEGKAAITRLRQIGRGKRGNAK